MTAAGGGSLPTEPHESVVKRARRLLQRQAEQARELGGSVAETHLRIGWPSYELVGLSDELGVDLLIVGSVSDYTVRSARCPVLVVHGYGASELVDT